MSSMWPGKIRRGRYPEMVRQCWHSCGRLATRIATGSTPCRNLLAAGLARRAPDEPDDSQGHGPDHEVIRDEPQERVADRVSGTVDGHEEPGGEDQGEADHDCRTSPGELARRPLDLHGRAVMWPASGLARAAGRQLGRRRPATERTAPDVHGPGVELGLDRGLITSFDDPGGFAQLLNLA